MDVGSSVDDRRGAAPAARPESERPGRYHAGRLSGDPDRPHRPKGFDLKACNLPDALQIWYSHPADGYFVLFPDGIASVYIVDVDGQRQVFETQYGSATSDKDVRELQAILDSINRDVTRTKLRVKDAYWSPPKRDGRVTPRRAPQARRGSHGSGEL